MKRKILSILICSLFTVASCMQAEKVSLDTSGAEGLLLSGLSIELGFFGGSGASTCYQGGICKIAVTAATYDGKMNRTGSPTTDGFATADAACQAEFGSNYLALLAGYSSGPRYPGQSGWVLKANTQYANSLGSITTDSTGFPGDNNSVAMFGATLITYWTGLATPANTNVCPATGGPWSYTGGGVGNTGFSSAGQTTFSGSTWGCSTTERHLVCVEQ